MTVYTLHCVPYVMVMKIKKVLSNLFYYYKMLNLFEHTVNVDVTPKHHIIEKMFQSIDTWNDTKKAIPNSITAEMKTTKSEIQ